MRHERVGKNDRPRKDRKGARGRRQEMIDVKKERNETRRWEGECCVETDMDGAGKVIKEAENERDRKMTKKSWVRVDTACGEVTEVWRAAKGNEWKRWAKDCVEMDVDGAGKWQGSVTGGYVKLMGPRRQKNDRLWVKRNRRRLKVTKEL